MSHNDGMPQRQDALFDQMNTVIELARKNGCYDAEDWIRNTFKNTPENIIIANGTDNPKVINEYKKRLPLPDGINLDPENTPEKKLVELDEEKVYTLLKSWQYESDEEFVRGQSKDICQTFGIPERRVPTVDREDIYAEIAGLTGYLFEKLDPEGKFKVSDQDIKIMNNYTDAIHALFAKTEEKK